MIYQHFLKLNLTLIISFNIEHLLTEFTSDCAPFFFTKLIFQIMLVEITFYFVS